MQEMNAWIVEPLKLILKPVKIVKMGDKMTFNEKKDLVTELTKLWYCTLVDHHKDNDGHFYIKMKWSYGQEPTFVVEHYGYILDELYQEFKTYEQALDYLISQLMLAIANECEFYLTNPNNEEWVSQFQPRFLSVKIALEAIKKGLNA
jgi:hypothetical protein